MRDITLRLRFLPLKSAFCEFLGQEHWIHFNMAKFALSLGVHSAIGLMFAWDCGFEVSWVKISAFPLFVPFAISAISAWWHERFFLCLDVLGSLGLCLTCFILKLI